MTFNAITTLNEIREHEPCREGWTKLLAHLGKTKADDEPLELMTILESNGFDDALWCIRSKSLERLSRHFQAWCAEQMLHHFEAEKPDDMRVRNQIAMMRNDNATNQERDAAQDAAWDAARATTRATAWDAAWSARDATWSAALATTRATTRATAWATAWDAEWSAARAARAARAITRAAQEKQLRKMIGGEK